MQDVLDLIKNYNTSRYLLLENYYRGKSPITSRKMAGNKPNNRIVSSFAINAVDTVTGYFMGNPVSYMFDDSNGDRVREILDDNDEQDINSEHAKQVSIKGADYELLFTDENGDLKIAQVNPENVLLEYNDDIIPKLVRATIYYPFSDKGYYYSIYQGNKRLDYETNEQGRNPKLVGDYDLIFDEIPIVEFSANSDYMGMFEKSISLIDAYEKAISDTANDMEYFTDAYFWLPGFGGFDPSNDEDMAKFREMRTQKVFMPTDDTDQPPQFITKQINDTATENHKNRLKNEIHKMLNIPDLSDEQFAGTQSGVSLKYKLWGLENICSTFERRFKRSLQHRFRLISQYLRLKGIDLDYRDIKMTFSRNLPDNTFEMAQVAEKFRNLVSDETLLSWIDRVDDAGAEMEKRVEEVSGRMSLSEPIEEPIEVDDDDTI